MEKSKKDVYKRQAPDVFWLADAKEATFIQGGWCVNLKEMLESDPEYDLADFYEDAINSTDYGDGGIYGVPFSFGARAIFYNKTLFEEAGVKTPQECVEAVSYTHLERPGAEQHGCSPFQFFPRKLRRA